jgi:4-hydroxythreonine-4-phosphate dehydrogenase
MNQPVIESHKPVIGMSSGDINGIGLELIIKTIADHRILELCTPIIFASNKAINFYRKTVPEANFSYQSIKDFTRVNPKQVNVFNCWEEEIPISPGQLTNEGGNYAVKSLLAATQALKQKSIHGLITAPVHKKNIQSPAFNFSGHTPFLKHYFEMNEVLMLMVADNMKVGVLSEHIPVKDVAAQVTRENLLSKLSILKDSLIKDFGVEKPKIAVLGLNPHAGDEGLIGREEEEIIKPTLKEFRQNNNAIVLAPIALMPFLREDNMKILTLY